MFNVVRSLIAGSVEIAPPKDNYKFEVDTATVEQGAAVKFTNDGKIEPAGQEDTEVAAIAMEKGEVEDEIRIFFVVPGLVFRCPMTKEDSSDAEESDIHNDLHRGRIDVQMNDDKTGLDCETDPGTKTGPLTLLKMDKENMTADVVFNSGSLWHQIDST